MRVVNPRQPGGGIDTTELLLTNGTFEISIKPSLSGFAIAGSDALVTTQPETTKLHVEKARNGRAYVIPADPEEDIFDIAWPVSLPDAQTTVGGPVAAMPMPGVVQMWVNEEGLLHAMDVNERACALAQVGVVGNALILEGDAQWT